MIVFTSCTNNYLAKARVLAKSCKHFHPEWEFVLLIGEELPAGFDLSKEPFDRVLQFSEIKIENYWSWLFKHRVVEICTAAKAPALKYFLTCENHDKVIYLDPDMVVFSSLESISNALDKYDIILAPHQLTPAKTKKGIIDEELCSSKYGIFNLGFFAVANRIRGLDFAKWWAERLYDFCYDDIPNGIFTDQKWCDHVPSFFGDALLVLRDKTCDVASWNLYERYISKNENGQYLVNGENLKFYHFTGYDSGAGFVQSSRFFDTMPQLKELWSEYGFALKANDQETVEKLKWKYLCFDNGEKITDAMRYLYRDKEDLRKKFPNPFEHQGYLAWYKKEIGVIDSQEYAEIKSHKIKKMLFLFLKQKLHKFLRFFRHFCE
ncbi:MAG: glycosyl transferase [Duodenibacillus sp.]|nr:glycosyl transferase [Duodenibacillus sp.]